MAEITYYMNYSIVFTDPEEYQVAVATSGGTSALLETPRAAGVRFNIPFPYPPADAPKTIIFYFPNIPGLEFLFPGPTGVFVDDTVNTTIGSVLGAIGVFIWSGNIIFSGAAATEGEPLPTAIPQRRWISGFELGRAQGGNSFEMVNSQGGSTNYTNRDSSRTIDGHGLSIRGGNTLGVLGFINTFRPGLNPNTSWERFYFRVRSFPTTQSILIWRAHINIAANLGFALRLNTSQELRAVFIDGLNVITDLGLVALPGINTWKRIDILVKFTAPGPGFVLQGAISVYVNRAFAFSFNNPNMGGGPGVALSHSILGFSELTPDANTEIDFDDWINSDLPANCDPSTLAFIDDNFSIDWLVGSHVRLHTTILTSQVNWIPTGSGVGILNQINPDNRTVGAGNELTSITSGALLSGLTDALPQTIADSYAMAIGATGALVVLFSRNTGGTDGQLGYSKAGGGNVLTTIDQTAGINPQRIAYLPSGMILPDEISPWSIVHTKSADANTDVSAMMMTEVEYIGIWGEEDNEIFSFPIQRLSNLHNCRYTNTQYGSLLSAPIAPVVSIGGTYVGNGTYQEIILPEACHFLLIRNASNPGSLGIRFFASSYGPQFGAARTIIPDVRMWFDFLTEQFKFSVIGGANSLTNVSGQTYQYIAFCDPGFRFNLCGSFSHETLASVPKINELVVNSFTPQLGLFQLGLSTAQDSTAGFFLKGPGSPLDVGTPLDGTALSTTFGNLGPGTINSLATLHTNNFLNYSLWRVPDSNGFCPNVAVQILTYTGTGSPSLVVNTTPFTGKFPLFILISPATVAGQSYYRDPSHVSNESSRVTGLLSTLAITAIGPDQFTVGTDLNVNAVVYNVFIIIGNNIGMTNGVFYQDYCINNGPYIPPSEPIPSILAEGGLILGGIPTSTILKDISGIYTIIPGKHNDTFIDRNVNPSAEIDVKIPDPDFKTGYIGG